MPKSNRLAGEDFQDLQKKKQAPSVVGCSVHAPAAGSDAKRSGNRIRPSLPRAHHLPRQSKPRRTWRVGGIHRCVVVAAGLVDDIKQRPKRGSKTASPAQKNLPLFAVVRRRSNSHPRLQGKSAKQERTWKRGVLHTVYSLQKKKKEAWTEFVVVASRGRSVGVGWRGGLEERTNAVDILLWCLVGGGRVTQGPLVWV